VKYGRPASNGRKLWGGIVPYGFAPNFPGFGNGRPMPWRAGANENTTISLEHPLLIEGKPLPAGIYGIHIIPAENAPWTVIFSRNSTSWGSFFYDDAEDALRVQVTPKPAPMLDRLRYEFVDHAGLDSVTLALHWGELQVPIHLKVANLPSLVMDQARLSLRGGVLTTPAAFREAATYALANKVNQQEALGWTDQSGPGFAPKALKAGLLKQLGRTAEADAVLNPALQAASEAELNTYGYQLLGQGSRDEALKIFELNVTRHPNAWNPLDSLAETQAARGNKEEAKRLYRQALEKLPTTDTANRDRINKILSQL
jgi:tetratricopeptide (TPR) repeat protein